MTPQVIYLKITVDEETNLKYSPKPMHLNALTVPLSLNWGYCPQSTIQISTNTFKPTRQITTPTNLTQPNHRLTTFKTPPQTTHIH